MSLVSASATALAVLAATLQSDLLGSTMQTFRYAYFPADVCTVHVALFADVANAAAVRARIIRSSITEGQEGEHEREAVNFAFVDACLVSAHAILMECMHAQFLERSCRLPVHCICKPP